MKDTDEERQTAETNKTEMQKKEQTNLNSKKPSQTGSYTEENVGTRKHHSCKQRKKYPEKDERKRS